VDYKSSLSINDLEFISNDSMHPIDSPYKRRPSKRNSPNLNSNLSATSPSPYCSKSVGDNNNAAFEVTTQSDLVPSIEALIRSNNFPTALKVNKVAPFVGVSENMDPKEELPKEPSFHMPPPPVPVTPNKRVQFSLLSTTPSPSRSPMAGACTTPTPTTPAKSILKDNVI